MPGLQLLESECGEGEFGSLGGCLAVEGLTPLYLGGLKIQQGDSAGRGGSGSRRGTWGVLRLTEALTVMPISKPVDFREGQDFGET